MKVIIAGSRDYQCTLEEMDRIVNASGFQITEVVCGGARGADEMGKQWAHSKNLPVSHYFAEWDRFGRRAGPIRNSKMAEMSSALIAIKTHPDSAGTNDMIRKATAKGLPVFVEEAYDFNDHTDLREP